MRVPLLALALVACGGTDDDTVDTDVVVDSDVPIAPTAACVQLIDCLQDVAPAEVADAYERYGEGGTCWDSEGNAAACDESCGGQLAEAWLASPTASACVPPPAAADDVLRTPDGDFVMLTAVIVPFDGAWAVELVSYDTTCTAMWELGYEGTMPTDELAALISLEARLSSVFASGSEGMTLYTKTPGGGRVGSGVDLPWALTIGRTDASLVDGDRVDLTLVLDPGGAIGGVFAMTAEVCGLTAP